LPGPAHHTSFRRVRWPARRNRNCPCSTTTLPRSTAATTAPEARTWTRRRGRPTSTRFPLTADEFVAGAAPFPDRLLAGDNPVPLALMGLNEGVNVFFDEMARGAPYIPAYIRRYPFLLARVEPNADNLSLCFDPDQRPARRVCDEGELFDGEQAAEHTKELLEFCQKFEEAGLRTQRFHRRAEEGRPADGRRSRHPPPRPARVSPTSIAASRWSTRTSCANSWRPAAQVERERPAAADLRPPPVA
jgi:hypothetical protein